MFRKANTASVYDRCTNTLTKKFGTRSVPDNPISRISYHLAIINFFFHLNFVLRHGKNGNQNGIEDVREFFNVRKKIFYSPGSILCILCTFLKKIFYGLTLHFVYFDFTDDAKKFFSIILIFRKSLRTARSASCFKFY